MELKQLLAQDQAEQEQRRAKRLALTLDRLPWQVLLNAVRAEHDRVQYYLLHQAAKGVPVNGEAVKGRRRRKPARPELDGFYEEYLIVLRRIRALLFLRAKVPSGIPPLKWTGLYTPQERARLELLYHRVPRKDKVKYVERKS